MCRAAAAPLNGAANLLRLGVGRSDAQLGPHAQQHRRGNEHEIDRIEVEHRFSASPEDGIKESTVQMKYTHQTAGVFA